MQIERSLVNKSLHEIRELIHLHFIIGTESGLKYLQNNGEKRSP